MDGDIPSFVVDMDAIDVNSPEFQSKPGGIDAVLYELLCTVHFLAMAPSLPILEQVICEELYQPALISICEPIRAARWP
jgi:hypothetical protein